MNHLSDAAAERAFTVFAHAVHELEQRERMDRVLILQAMAGLLTAGLRDAVGPRVAAGYLRDLADVIEPKDRMA